MKFNFVTLFPNLIKPYFEDSILKRAVNLNLIKIEFLNPRDYSLNKYKKVDDYMVGGGAGLLLECQTLSNLLDNLTKSKIIFLSPSGKKFTQNDAIRLSKFSEITFVCGRYEGFDERVIELYADEIFSIGDYVLTGGELASCVLCDAISRNISGVLGNENSLQGESFENDFLEAPNFAKPNIFRNLIFPSVFLKGNHSKISALKNQMSFEKTKFHRPDLFKKISHHKGKIYEK